MRSSEILITAALLAAPAAWALDPVQMLPKERAINIAVRGEVRLGRARKILHPGEV